MKRREKGERRIDKYTHILYTTIITKHKKWIVNQRQKNQNRYKYKSK